MLAFMVTMPVFAKQVVYKQFNDWIVACDNVGWCEASGMNQDDVGMLTLLREPGAKGALSLRLESPKAIDRKRLRADKKPVETDLSQWKVTNEQDYHTLASEDFATVLGLIGQMRHARHLSFGGGEGNRVSLSGFNAALLLMDETQGRLDTGTALLRRGNKPGASVPNAEPEPVIRAAPLPKRKLGVAEQNALIAQVRQAQRAAFKVEDCSPGDEEMGTSAAMLDEQNALVMIECLRGAYQVSSMVFKVPLQDPEQAQRLILEIPAGNSPVGKDRDMVTMGAFEGGELMHAAKGRGLADCGESMRWIWDGKKFQLLDMTYMGSCRGGEPGMWPVLWRAKFVR